MPFGRSLSATAGAQEPFPWWFPLAFIGMWLVVSTVLALIAGHMAVLSRFAPVSVSAQERFLFASGSVRGVSFRSAPSCGDQREGATPRTELAVPADHPPRDPVHPVGRAPMHQGTSGPRGMDSACIAIRDPANRTAL